MSRVYNFSAGPAMMPGEILKTCAEEMLDYPGYKLFPAVPGKIDTNHLKMRGGDLSAGFRYVP